MTIESVKDFFEAQKKGVSAATAAPCEPDYWWQIISLYHQGHDPNADGMVVVPVDQLEELQQSYVRALCALEEIAGEDTSADIARQTLGELKYAE